MAAFVSSLMIVVVGISISWLSARRRPQGTPLTWGEAILAGSFVFALMIVAYGVVPHQWLNFADNELLWRRDKILMGISSAGIKIGAAAKSMGGSGRVLVTYQALRDTVAATLYIVFLGAHMVLWSKWQKRGRGAPELEPTSRFGRPLIRRA